MWPSLRRVTSTVHRKMNMGLRTRAFISHTPIDKLIYQIYQLVGGFLAKFVSSCISQNILFHMIGNIELPFHFLKLGRFQYWSYTFKEFLLSRANMLFE